jgi:hypothetical protein
MRFQALTRTIALSAMLACALAVVVARSAPRPAAFRVRREAQAAVVNGTFLGRPDSEGQVLDAATGAFAPLPMPAGETLESAAFSAWVDDGGGRQVAGRWVRRTGPSGNRTVECMGLGRFSYPGGEPLDRVGDVPTPASAVCWCPGAAPRVLFTTWDGRLFRYAFGAARVGGAPARGALSRVAWPEPPPPLRAPCFDHLTWPTDARLRGRAVASVGEGAPGPGGRARRQRRLWWLRLSPDALRVEEAGRMDDPAREDPAHEETLPSLGRGPDGRLLLAYRRLSCGGRATELFVAPVTVDARTGVPRVRLADARKLDDEVIGSPAVFSADGQWVYALHKESGEHASLRRYPLRPPAEAPGPGTLAVVTAP